MRVTAIAQWIRLRLQTCSRGLESQVQHLPFSNLYLNWDVKRTKIIFKEAGIGP